MAGAGGRGSRAAGHGARRSGDERDPAHDDAALRVPLRALGRPHDFRRRHRQLLRPPAGVRAHSRRLPSRRRHAFRRSAVLPLGPHLPLRPREPRPLADGAQDPRGLGGRARLQVGAGCRRRLRARRADDAVPAPPRPHQGGRSRALGAGNRRLPLRQQRQRRRRLLLAGRPVLLRARPGPPEDARGHRQRRPRRPRRHPRPRQGRRARGDRKRAASRPVRLQRPRRRRRRRHPDAQGRAGPGRAPARARRRRAS